MTIYTNLTDDVKSWTQNKSAELNAETDQIIANCMERIVRDLPIQPFLKQDTASFTIGSSTISRPNSSRFVEMREFSYVDASSNYVRIEYRQESFVKTIYPNASTQGSPVYYYTDTAGTWRVGPVPDAALTYTLEYLQRPVLDGTTTTNWLTDNAYNLLLAAALAEAARFVRDQRQPNLLEVNEAIYQRELAKVKEAELGFELDGRKI